MTDPDRLRLDYRAALLRYLPRREEAALHHGYQLGRSAVVAGTSILELAALHQQIFLEVLAETRADEVSEMASAAAEFFLEVLGPYDMTQRGLLDRGTKPPA